MVKPKEGHAKKDWTTLIVQKSTRDIVNKIAEEKNFTQDELVLDFINARTGADATKQIIIDMDSEKYSILKDVAEFLYNAKSIQSPDISVCVKYAIDNVIQGVMQGIQNKTSKET